MAGRYNNQVTMPKRNFDGDPLDLSWQDLKDRPYKGRGETVDATPEDSGRITTEGTDEVFGLSGTAKRAKELIPAFRMIEDNDELWSFIESHVSSGEGVDDKPQAIAATIVLMERSDDDANIFDWLRKYQDGKLSGEAFAEIFIDVAPD